MTVDEIKDTYTMTDILLRYGMKPNRAGFVRCPFHEEKTASMKVYKDSYHCFGCGESGDIFAFVQKMDGVNFKEAFLALGGTYAKENTRAARFAAYEHQRAARTRRKKAAKEKAILSENLARMGELMGLIEDNGLMSDIGADAYNKWQLEVYKNCQLTGVDDMGRECWP